jgi:hypothetical protein
MTESAPDLPPEEERRRTRTARLVIIGLIILAIVLGTMLFMNYSRFLGYVDDTLDDDEQTFPWEEVEHYPVEACVDSALDWAEACVGIKTLCDEYVTRYMNMCLGSESRVDYCNEFTVEDTGTTGFGAEECSARGVQRHVDYEACSKAYRAIASYCEFVRDREELREQQDASGSETQPID